MPFDPPPVAIERAWLLAQAAPRNQQARSCGLEVLVAEFGDGCGTPPFRFLAGRVGAADDLPQDALGFVPGRIRGPGRAMPPDRRPALAPLLVPVEQHIRDRGALLPPGAEAASPLRVPNNLPGLKGAHVAKPDHLPFGHVRLAKRAAC